MKKLDFSRISTEVLKKQVRGQSEQASFCCISCSDCPFELGNCTDKIANKAFIKELERREKEMNEMPELKAGMIVELENGKIKIVLPNTVHPSGLGLYNKNGSGADNPEKAAIISVYTNGSITYYAFFTDGEISVFHDKIWSKKSDKDIEIEALEATINRAAQQIKDIKNGNK